MAVVLAVDWGQRRIGLAVCDPMQILASPRPTLAVHGPEDAVRRVAAVARAEEAERIVVGLPLHLSGAAGEAAAAARRFADELATATGLLLELLDERLTSAAAADRLRDLGRPFRRGGDKGRIDQMAAVILLEDWLARDAQRARRAAPALPEAPGEPEP